MSKADELSERLLNFGVRVIKLSQAVQRSPLGRHLAVQVLRSGTSCGANYEEARAAESRRDFSHKLGIVLKELRECRFWLLLFQKAGLVQPKRIAPLLVECEELCAIVGKSIITAKQNES